jgi:mannose-1-phosphate guanylyltransferase / phosphomannomutase
MMMAAGAGTRLRPLTYRYPKPMVPVVNKPVMEHALENAARHGLRDIVVNLHHAPQPIRDYFGDGSRWGLRLRYSEEKKLMGTAGGVKKMESFLGAGTFLILSGDGLSEIDLTAALEFHRKRKAFATMVLSRVNTRFEYGVTLTDRSGRIRRFIEKPGWSDVFANTVNSGVYVFEPGIFRYIPAGRPYDFGSQVWPRLLADRKPIYGFLSDDYWCDIGNLQEYRRGQKDALTGRMKHAVLPGRRLRDGVRVGEGSVIARGARLVAPCVIGRNARVASGSQVGPFAVIGDHARIGAAAVVQESVLWDHVTVGARARLADCIVGHRASVQAGAVVTGGVLMHPRDVPR